MKQWVNRGQRTPRLGRPGAPAAAEAASHPPRDAAQTEGYVVIALDDPRYLDLAANTALGFAMPLVLTVIAIPLLMYYAIMIPFASEAVLGVRAQNVDPCTVELTGSFKDPGNGQVRLDQRLVNLRVRDGGVAYSAAGAINLWANVPLCPNQWASRDAFGQTFRLDVTLKERRRLVLGVRETPLHSGHLRTLLSLSDMGAIVAPLVPAFYNRPQSIDDIVNHSVGRVLDLFDIDSGVVKRWKTGETSSPQSQE